MKHWDGRESIQSPLTLAYLPGAGQRSSCPPQRVWSSPDLRTRTCSEELQSVSTTSTVITRRAARDKV